MAVGTGTVEESAREREWGIGAAGLVVAIVVSAIVVALYALGRIDLSPFLLWASVVVFLLACFGIAGLAMCGRYVGFLINGNNVMSASRAQAALWFVAILST